jgi:hypothetical protein
VGLILPKAHLVPLRFYNPYESSSTRIRTRRTDNAMRTRKTYRFGYLREPQQFITVLVTARDGRGVLGACAARRVESPASFVDNGHCAAEAAQ